MPRETAFLKARRYLTEGRLRVLRVESDRLEASCRGDGQVWHQGWHGGRWICDCPTTTDQCCHLIALRLVVIAPDPTPWRDSTTKPRPNAVSAFEAGR